MVKLGDNEVIFSTSFVMDKHTVNSAFVSVPNYPVLDFQIKLVEAPTTPTELESYRWYGIEYENEIRIVSFSVMPESKTEFHSISVGMADKGFQVQILRQSIFNNTSMLVHVIVVQEPR